MTVTLCRETLASACQSMNVARFCQPSRPSNSVQTYRFQVQVLERLVPMSDLEGSVPGGEGVGPLACAVPPCPIIFKVKLM